MRQKRFRSRPCRVRRSYGVVIYQILLSCVWGALLGYLARKTLRWAETKGLIDKENLCVRSLSPDSAHSAHSHTPGSFAYGLGLALLVLGTTGLFGSDDVLACFVAGNSFTWDDYYRIRTHEEETDAFQDILDALLSSAAFIYVGAIIPWNAYNTGAQELGIAPWRVVVLGLGVLLLRRLPAVLLLHKLIPALTTWDEALFTGWFGPIGVSAVYYIEIAHRQVPADGSRERLRALYEPLVLFLVFASVMGHGTTIPISKLGPHIVRRTATMTQTRSMTQSRPPSRRPTIAAAAGEAAEPSRTHAQASKGLFERLFGFASKPQTRVQAKDIGAPSGARRQREVSARGEEGEAEGQAKLEQQEESSGSSDEIALEERSATATPALAAGTSSSTVAGAASRSASPKRRAPAQPLTLPTTHRRSGGTAEMRDSNAGSSPLSSAPGTPLASVPGTPQRPAAAARDGSILRHAGSASGSGILAHVEHALSDELRRERQEALGERGITWGETEGAKEKE
jgi:NhaP-type Na+/H+ or K+/H+ antiporter